MIRILSGEATEEEEEQFYSTMNIDPKNRETFESMRSDWESASDAMIFKGIDIEEAWDKQCQTISETSSSNSVEDNNKNYPFLKWAASVALLLGLAIFLLNQNSTELPNSDVTSNSEVKSIVLSDGTQVALNENSSIEYLITDDVREVTLTGEAYFEVAHNKAIPFIINTERAYVKVLGTSFGVNSYGTITTVMVDEGKVELGMADGSEKVILTSGELGEVSGKQLVEKTIVQPNSTSWYTKSLVFDQASLNEVLRDLEKTYYLKFNYWHQTGLNCHLTANFSNEKIENIFAAISLIFNVEFIPMEEGSFTVRVLGCK